MARNMRRDAMPPRSIRGAAGRVGVVAGPPEWLGGRARRRNGAGDQQAQRGHACQPGGQAGDDRGRPARGAPGDGRGEHAEDGEHGEAERRQAEPAARHDAEHRAQHAGQHDRPDDQRQLVVGAEGLDGEALDRPWRPVDDGGGHGLDRRGEVVLQARHQLTDAQGERGGYQAADGARDPAGLRLGPGRQRVGAHRRPALRSARWGPGSRPAFGAVRGPG